MIGIRNSEDSRENFNIFRLLSSEGWSWLGVSLEDMNTEFRRQETEFQCILISVF